MKQNKKETKTKMTYLEWYEQDWERRRQIKKSPSFYYYFLLPVFLIGSFFISFIGMGEQALTYSDQVYENIRVVMDHSLIKGTGINSKILQEGVDVEEEATGHIDHYDKVDRYADIYNENGHSLEATIKNGYLEATVTAILDENFQVAKVEKNFGNAKDYMVHYGTDLATSFVYGFGIWAIVGIIFNFVSGLIADFCRHRNEKKKAAEIAIEATNENEQPAEMPEIEKTEEQEESEEKKKNEAEIKEFPQEAVSL